jgi:hypothetical protein
MSGCCIDSATSRCMQTLSQQCLVWIISFIKIKKKESIFYLVTSRFNMVSYTITK